MRWSSRPARRSCGRDASADFAIIPSLGRAAITSFARHRRHTVLWTDRRIVVAQKPLFSSRPMITHQVPSATRIGSVSGAAEAAAGFGGGFYGRGFSTLVAATIHLGKVNGKDCVQIAPTADSREAMNVAEALVFTDRLSELRQALAAPGSEPGA